MKFYGQCGACQLKRLFIRKRRYYIPFIKERVTSQSEQCGKCYKGMKKAIKNM